MKRGAVVLCAVGLLAACASADTVKESRGQGPKRTLRYGHEAVYQAAVAVAARRKLEIVEQDRAAGRLVLSNGASWTSLGERIAVFVTRASDRSTTVEVVSRPVAGVLSLPPDWPKLLLGDIEQELAERRAR